MTSVASLVPAPSQCGAEEFVDSYRHIYEKSPWVCQALVGQLGSGQLDTVEALHAAMKGNVDRAPDEVKLKLLKEHPELGSKSAIFGDLEAASLREQSSLGLTDPTNVHLERLQSLNKTYRERFGFPFIVAITGLTVMDVFRAFDERIANTKEVECEMALEQVHKIARIRLCQMSKQGET